MTELIIGIFEVSFQGQKSLFLPDLVQSGQNLAGCLDRNNQIGSGIDISLEYNTVGILDSVGTYAPMT